MHYCARRHNKPCPGVYTIVCISGLIPRARSLGMRLMYIPQFVYYHSTCMQFSLVLKDTTDLCDDSTCRGWQSVQHTAVWAGHPRVQHRLGHTGLHCHRWDMVCRPHTPHLWPGRAIARVACNLILWLCSLRSQSSACQRVSSRVGGGGCCLFHLPELIWSILPSCKMHVKKKNAKKKNLHESCNSRGGNFIKILSWSSKTSRAYLSF